MPVFNNWNLTKSCLNYFKKHQSDIFEVIVVDNGSSDLTQTEIVKFKHELKNLKYYRFDENRGFGQACNKGYDLSENEFVLFLNNDIMFATSDAKWIEDLIKFIENNKNALIGPTGGLLNKSFGFVYETNDKSKPINYMSGWFLAGSKDTFNKLIEQGNEGPFDAKTFFVYFEDADLSFRAKIKNIEFLFYSVPLHHIGKQTSKKLNTSALYLESKEKFIKKWTSKSKTK